MRLVQMSHVLSCMSLSDPPVSAAKAAEQIEMPFARQTNATQERCVRWRVHIRATWRIRLSDTCAAEMRHYVKLLWPLVWLVSLPSLPAVQLLKFKQHQLVCFSDNYVIIITFKALFITHQIHRVIVTPLTDLLSFWVRLFVFYGILSLVIL